jgi:hypothetical protein
MESLVSDGGERVPTGPWTTAPYGLEQTNNSIDVRYGMQTAIYSPQHARWSTSPWLGLEQQLAMVLRCMALLALGKKMSY